MDKAFSYFFSKRGFGPAENTESISAETVARYKGKLPDLLLSYWQEYGWSSYGKGLFWLVDPAPYEPVVKVWLRGTPFVENDAHYVIARSAFGRLFLWGTNSGQSLNIEAPRGQIFPMDSSEDIRGGHTDRLVESFFMVLKKERLDFEDVRQRPLFERAVAVLGPLSAGEMYGFEPALALGGTADLKNLRKLDAVTHLMLLAELGERKIMRDIVKDAQALGLIKKQ
jgi:hypothetical protein